jgi:hypothetical protein
MNNQLHIADRLTKILGWRRINDNIRAESPARFWQLSPDLQKELSELDFLRLTNKISETTTFGLPDFSQTHSGGEISFQGNMYHWEIRYHVGDKILLDPLLIADSDRFTTSGYIELLGDFDPIVDPLPF